MFRRLSTTASVIVNARSLSAHASFASTPAMFETDRPFVPNADNDTVSAAASPFGDYLRDLRSRHVNQRISPELLNALSNPLAAGSTVFDSHKLYWTSEREAFVKTVWLRSHSRTAPLAESETTVCCACAQFGHKYHTYVTDPTKAMGSTSHAGYIEVNPRRSIPIERLRLMCGGSLLCLRAGP